MFKKQEDQLVEVFFMELILVVMQCNNTFCGVVNHLQKDGMHNHLFKNLDES
jgi:hypothetical protein